MKGEQVSGDLTVCLGGPALRDAGLDGAEAELRGIGERRT